MHDRTGGFGRTAVTVLALVTIATALGPSVARGAEVVPAAAPTTTGVAPTVGANGPATVRGTWSAAPSTTFTFDALSREGAEWPADPTGAIGERWFLAAANASVAVYDLSGHAVVGPASLAGLFSLPARIRASDPRIVYDQYRSRFVLAFLAVDAAVDRSWIMMVSIPDATADDASTWCGVRVAGDRTIGDGRQLVGGTGLGYDGDTVVVTANTYGSGDGRFDGATVLSFPKRRLYDCSRSVRFDTFTGRETRNPSGTPASSIQPAVTVGGGRRMYLTSFVRGRSNTIVLWRLSGAGGHAVLDRVALHVPPVASADVASQAGADVANVDAAWRPGGPRLVSTFADLGRGRVYTAQTIATDLGPDPGGSPYVESAVRWYEVRPTAGLRSSHVLRIGTIGTPETDAGWPSLATDAAGNLFVTYSRASAITGEYLSAWVAEIAPATTTATTRLLRAGTARFETTDGPEPWGSHSAMSRDPVDGRFMVAVNQVAVSDGSGTTRDWRETVTVLSDDGA